jgi:MoaA/NifB/PqqE/SkfB family radical SAM enzyme
VTGLGALRTSAMVRMSEALNRTLVLPVVIFHPTSRCNSRCVSCDWWKSSGATDLTLAEIDALADQLPALGTRLVIFSGGEPLLRPEVFEAARLFTSRGIALHLLTSGVLLDRCTDDVARHFERVIVSLDSPTDEGYRSVRGVQALATVERGVARLRRIAPSVPLTARATLHRMNFWQLPQLIEHARAMALDGISFLAADVSSLAFGRARTIDPSPLLLDRDEVARFDAIVAEVAETFRADFLSGFIAESPEKLRRLPRYYAAIRGEGPFPSVACNAPWMSLVVEADGRVRPCFFHDYIGNLRDETLQAIVADRLPAFRARLDVSTNPVCTRCVCSMRTGFRSTPWH